MIYLMVQFNGLGVVFPLLVLFEAEARLALSYAHRVNGQLLEFYAVDERANTDLPFVGFADVETGSRWNILGRAIDGSLAKPPVAANTRLQLDVVRLGGVLSACKLRSGTAKACWQAPPPSLSLSMEYCSVILFWARTSPIPSTPLP
jgi:hypothetical protein